MLKCHRRILLSGPLRRHASSSSTLPRIKVDLERYLQDTTATMALLEERKVPFSREHLQELETNENSRKGLTRQLDELRRHQKSFHSDTRLKDQAIELRREVKLCSTALKDTEERIERLSNSLPNWTAPNVPVGDYQACQVVHTSDRAPRTLSQTEQEACDHLDVATRLGWLDFSSGQRISGPRWPVLKREGALLEWALTQYALQRATAYGFQPFNPPDVVKTALSDRCGFQPRDGQASQSYYVSADASASTNEDHNEERPELVLAGTAEIPLAGHFTHQTFQPSDLPQQLVALGRAFRAEAGARGKEHRGLYRVHQFTKAELFVVCHPDESEAWLDQLTQLQLDILDGLHLPLRSVLLA